MVIIRQNNLQESMLLKISVRICPSFWYQMALFRVLAHGLRGRDLRRAPLFQSLTESLEQATKALAVYRVAEGEGSG